MTPAARYAASIDILELIFMGDPAEKTLTNWARKNRYAGSKDRAAVRDIVFACLRSKRSYQFMGGQKTARGTIIGRVLHCGENLSDIFTGIGYAPSVMDQDDQGLIQDIKQVKNIAIRENVQDWILPLLQESLGQKTEKVCGFLQERAPIDIRANSLKININKLQNELSNDKIETVKIEQCDHGLRLVEQTRKLVNTNAYLSGLFELQDAGSQFTIQDLVGNIKLKDEAHILDYCAGGGGKSLALASLLPSAKIWAYDKILARLDDLQRRSTRAGVNIMLLEQDPISLDAVYDLVLLDVPCSGTGAWRRHPDSKWKLTQEKLNILIETQFEILNNAQKLVAENGYLAYVTCSILSCENQNQVKKFLHHNTDWSLEIDKSHVLGDPGDGFFHAVFKRKS